MGTDIRGWVDFREAWLDESVGETNWYPVIDAGWLLARDYSAFGALFGVRNSNFAPVAARRGLPEDVSDFVRQDAAWKGSHDHTWITWQELREIDWSESAVDTCVHKYQRSENGEWVRVGGFRSGVERVTRREALVDTGFDLVFEMMEAMAKRYGDACVRLVVWFDD